MAALVGTLYGNKFTVRLEKNVFRVAVSLIYQEYGRCELSISLIYEKTGRGTELNLVFSHHDDEGRNVGKKRNSTTVIALISICTVQYCTLDRYYDIGQQKSFPKYSHNSTVLCLL